MITETIAQYAKRTGEDSQFLYQLIQVFSIVPIGKLSLGRGKPANVYLVQDIDTCIKLCRGWKT
jgi:hypothetical protein